jgi:hypothetical protein
MESKYFALFCTQTQTYMSCGHNSRTIEELIQCYRDYDLEMEENLSNDEVIQIIRCNDYIIEDSLIPFDSLENDLED